MAKVIIMPKLGFTQDEGSLVAWHKQIGESVKKGEPFFDVHTDKSVVTIDAAENGTLLKIVVEPETTVPVFTPIAVIGDPGEDADAALKAHVMDVAPDAAVKADFDDDAEETAKEEAPAQQETDIKSLKLTPKAKALIKNEGYDVNSVAKIQGTGFEGGITAKDIKASPLAKKIADEMNVPLESVSGSGAQGRVMKKDVLAAATQKKEDKGTEDKQILEKIPYSGVRKIIGDRLSQSKFTAPHLYFTDSIDTTNLTAFRKMLNEKSEQKIAFSDLLVKAVSKALVKFPNVNASLVDNEIVVYKSTNIGSAVAGDNGLIVPVIKNAQEKTLTQIAQESRDLVERAKTGRLKPEEYSGGTFSISNLGMFGIENFTAIINPPEAAILSVSSIRKKAVVVTNEAGEDEICIRPMMNIQLTVDHRIIDGLLASQFVEYVKKLLEEPLKILI